MENLNPVPILQLDLSYCLNSGFIECKALTKLRSHSQIDCFNKSSFSEIDFFQIKHYWVQSHLIWLTTRIMFNIVNIGWNFQSFQVFSFSKDFTQRTLKFIIKPRYIYLDVTYLSAFLPKIYCFISIINMLSFCSCKWIKIASTFYQFSNYLIWTNEKARDDEPIRSWKQPEHP